MKVMIMVGADSTRCYLEITACFLKVGMVKIQGFEHSYPCVEVSYDLNALLYLSKVFAEMRKSEQLPEIYIWDEGAVEPEVLVLFRLKKPSEELLRTVCGTFASTLTCDEVLATGEANVDKTYMHTFLEAFRMLKFGVVLVTDSTSTSDTDANPVVKFLVNNVYRKKPDILGMQF